MDITHFSECLRQWGAYSKKLETPSGEEYRRGLDTFSEFLNKASTIASDEALSSRDGQATWIQVNEQVRQWQNFFQKPKTQHIQLSWLRVWLAQVQEKSAPSQREEVQIESRPAPISRPEPANRAVHRQREHRASATSPRAASASSSTRSGPSSEAGPSLGSGDDPDPRPPLENPRANTPTTVIDSDLVCASGVDAAVVVDVESDLQAINISRRPAPCR